MSDVRELADGKLRVDEPAEGVARLTIANPARRNALDHPILDGMAEVLSDLDARCVIITGSDGMFSAGYDLGDLADADFSERAESSSRIRSPPRSTCWRPTHIRPSPASAATRSAAGSRWRSSATCASLSTGSSSACRPPSSGSSTPTPACAASSRRSAPAHARAVPPRAQRGRRDRAGSGASSTGSSSADGARGVHAGARRRDRPQRAAVRVGQQADHRRDPHGEIATSARRSSASS